MNLRRGPNADARGLHAHRSLAALNIAGKIMSGNPDASGPGYQTPARNYGADLVLDIDGVARQDERVQAS